MPKFRRPDASARARRVKVREPRVGPPKVSRESQLYKALLGSGVAELVLRGQMLVIDPSSGSGSSLPGYAIFSGGECSDSGLVEMPIGTPLTTRLRYLNRCLREQFPEKYDVLVVELIPPFRMTGARASAAAQLSLHKAVAVVESSFEVSHTLYVAPATWHMYAPPEHLSAKRQGAHTDEQDAVVMGEAVVAIAREIQSRRK